ncbi:MAG TPA: class I SAM-dependent methyltransferase [Pseudonocardia sp.]
MTDTERTDTERTDTERGLAALELLTGPAGRAVSARLAGVEVTPSTELGVAAALRREHPAELVTAALALHELRGRAAAKFDRADAMFLSRDGLEQASSETVARHRARRFAGLSRLVDLCCGIGGDLLALAGELPEVLAVDRDPVHLRMAELNAGVYGVAGAVRTRLADVRDTDLAGVPAAFVDPARRRSGARMRTGDSEPPLDWCLALADRVPSVGVKAAPGLDRARVPAGWEAEFVADGRELKEAVLWSPELAGGTSRATLLPGGDELLPDGGRDDAVPVAPPGGYLLDPNPAVTRAGLVADLARRLGAWKIDPMIAFLSADAPLRTPFGRSLRVLDSGPWREKELAARLRAVDAGAVDIRRRGLAGDVQALHRRLRPALAAGSRPVTLVMTRTNDRPWALVCADDRAG